MTGSIDLRGQVSVVTGGGRGLGRAFAQALAAAGSPIAVVARSAAEIAETVALIERAGGQARAFTVDITDADGCGHRICGNRALARRRLTCSSTMPALPGPSGPFSQCTSRTGGGPWTSI